MRKSIAFGLGISLLIAVLAFAGCGGGGSGGKGQSGTPEAAAKSFWEASLTGDADTSWSLLSTRIQTGLGDKKAWADSGVSNSLGDGKVVAGKSTVEGDSATVKVKVLNGGREIFSHDTKLVRENGEWKVAAP